MTFGIVLAFFVVVTTSETIEKESNTFGHRGDGPSYAVNTDITGAGATFGHEVVKMWLTSFSMMRNQFKKVLIRYKAVGSLEGLSLYRDDGRASCNMDFALSNDPMVEQSLSKKELDDMIFVPLLGGATAFGFNIRNHTQLTLSRESAVGIFSGTIEWWDSAEIAANNKDASFPHKKIKVIARKDHSGTTRGITYALSKFSDKWNSGVFSEPKWKPNVISYLAKGASGTIGLLSSIDYTIGYLPASSAATSRIQIARLMNKNGNAILPYSNTTREAIKNGMDAVETTEHLAQITDATGNNSYPLVSLLYMIVRKKTSCNCDRALELGRFIEWVLTSKEAEAIIEEARYTDLGKTIKSTTYDNVFRKYLCNGQNVFQLMVRQKNEEFMSTQSWRIPVAITSSIVGAVMAIALCFLIQKQVKLARAIQSQEWLIPSADIRFVKVQKHTLWTSEAATYHAFNVTQKYAHASPSKVGHMLDPIDDAEKGSIGGSSIDECDDVVGRWKENIVVMKEIDLGDISTLYRDTMATILWMKNNINHVNVQTFYGLTILSDQLYLVREYSPKGVLKEILMNEKFSFDNNFKFSLIQDVACGMLFLHSRDIVHGYLRADACTVDQKWTVKIKDWEFTRLLDIQGIQAPLTPPGMIMYDQNEHPNLYAKELFWTAPEHLLCDRTSPTKNSDLFSFGVLIQEVFTRENPYSEMADELQPQDIIEEIKKAGLRPMIRPDTPSLVRNILFRLWEEEPYKRPSFSQLLKIITSSHPSKKTVLDTMMEALESYVLQLEDKVDNQVDELAEAITAVQNILHDILPPAVADQITLGNNVDAKYYPSVSVLVARITNFNELVSNFHPCDIMELVNDAYLVMSVIIERHDIKKIEAVGDSNVFVSGLLTENGLAHAEECCNAALDIQSAFSKFHMRARKKAQLAFRFGVHTGAVITAVVGLKVPHFSVFGETYSIAHVVEWHSTPGKILVTETTCEILKKKTAGWKILFREKIDVDKKLLSIPDEPVEMKTYYVVGKDGYNPTFAHMVVKTYCSFQDQPAHLIARAATASSSESQRDGTDTSVG